jgi:hypothetical protein
MARSKGRPSLTTVVACLITFAWSVSFTLDMFMQDFEPHPSITPLMLATAGYLFGGEVMSKRNETKEAET